MNKGEESVQVIKKEIADQQHKDKQQKLSQFKPFSRIRR